MEKDLISIVIIIYNTEKYLKDCFESIVNQTYKNIEIVVVNDGSKDNSADIVQTYTKKDNRIKFINRKENKGTMYTRREGYENSTGKYVTFVDSDDMLELDAIEKMYSEIKNNKCDIVKCCFSIYKDGVKSGNKNFDIESKLYTKNNFEPEFYDLIYSTIKMNTMCGMLIKREMLSDISKVNTKMIYGEDISCNLYMYNNISSILFIDDPLYVYRQNTNSITYTFDSKKIRKKLEDSIVTYKKMYDFVDVYKIKNEKKYKAYAADKFKWYTTSLIITLCDGLKYKELVEILQTIMNDKDVIKIIDSSNNDYIILGNKLLRKAINLLYCKKYKRFYIYSKYVYLNLKKIRRKVS